MKGSDIIVKILVMLGVDNVFGYPGGYVLDIYDSLRRHNDSITHHLLNTEQSCVFAADGYARSSGRLGVVIATSGPGACNLVTGIASANMDSVPLLAITGNVPTSKLGSDSFQEVDIFGVTMPITKYNYIVKTVEELPYKLVEVAKIALSNRQGATLIDIPEDIQQDELDIDDRQLEIICKIATPLIPTPSRADIENAARIINSANKVAVLVGGGCKSDDSQQAVMLLAKKLNLPIVTTLMGVSYFDNTADNYLGLSGSHGIPVANHALKVADVIITLGARFGDRLLAGGGLGGKKLIQIDIDKAEHDKNIEAVSFLHGEIELVLSQLIKLVTIKDSSFLNSMLTFRQKVGAGDNQRARRNMLSVLADCLGSGIVATDVGEHQIFTAQNYCFDGRLLSSSGLGAMGYGLPAIIGCCIANSNQKSLLITGDGSINMSLVELSTVAHYDLPLLIVIFNNHQLGMCTTLQELRYGQQYMTNTPAQLDYIAICKAFKISCHRVSDTKSLKRMLQHYDFSHPLVIEIEME